MNSQEIMDKGTAKKEKKYFILSEVLDYKQDNYLVRFQLPEGEVVLQFLSPEIVRVVMGKRDKANLSSTEAVVSQNSSFSDFSLTDSSKYLNIDTGAILIKVNKEQFGLEFYDQKGRLIHQDLSGRALGWSGDEVRAWKKIKDGERFYGLGEKTGFLDKKGKKYTMWNTDVFEPHVESTDPLYISVPFLIGFLQGEAYGIYFDNSYKSYFDLGSGAKNSYSFWADGGKMDYYFIYGPDIKEVVARYTGLTGRMPLPPKWSLGYHQSRYSYHPEEEVREVGEQFRKRNIPCDAIHLDIHYMDGYRVFTWNEEEFPGPEEMLNDLKDMGYKVVTIIDPGVKKDPEYHVYKEGIKKDYFCKYLDGKIFEGKVWPGVSVFPDFTRKEVRKWWGDLHRKFIEQGVQGFWNDMNEPAVFNDTSTMDVEVFHDHDGDPGTHKRFHNMYGFFEGKATYQGVKKHLKQRPFVLSRAAFAGSQRYTAVWTGDNRSFWAHLEMAMPMLMNLGLSGLPFAGTDVGGFAADTDPELLTRWTQLGTFMPFFRNHSALDCIKQEPWVFGEKYEEVIRDYISLRYRFIEHLYNLFHQSSQEGLPVMRPLVLEFPEDTTTYNLSDQFMVGEDILVAPVYKPDRKERMVYLPGGEWVDFWTGEKYRGSSHILVEAPLETLPVYIKAGSIIPLSPVREYIGQEVDELELNVYLAEGVDKNNYLFYEDDGLSFAYEDGQYNLIEFSYERDANQLIFNIDYHKQGYNSSFKKLVLRLKNFSDKPEEIVGQSLNVLATDFDKGKKELIIKLTNTKGKVIIK